MKFDDNITVLLDWTDLVNQHWHRREGDLHNDKLFWQECLHDSTDQQWQAWVDVWPAVRTQLEEYVERFPKLAQDTADIDRKLMLGHRIVKPFRPGSNTQCFRVLMQIKDIINYANGTPTVQYDKTKPKETVKPYEALFSDE